MADQSLTRAQYIALDVVDSATRNNTAAQISRKTSLLHHTVAATSARALVRSGHLEEFGEPNGIRYVRRAAPQETPAEETAEAAPVEQETPAVKLTPAMRYALEDAADTARRMGPDFGIVSARADVLNKLIEAGLVAGMACQITPAGYAAIDRTMREGRDNRIQLPRRHRVRP